MRSLKKRKNSILNHINLTRYANQKRLNPENI